MPQINNLNKKRQAPGALHIIIASGLVAAMIILASGFIAGNAMHGTLKNSGFENNGFEKNTPGLEDLYMTIKNPLKSGIDLINYLGFLILILTPFAGLIYVLAYYSIQKNSALILITVAVIIILALSAATGFLK